ncbi:DNA-directed RNA polymerase, subunit N [Ignisphaera aggregans DSM 17230]|uniref:DNA-directed RNA polymerase subunit Rpo10 n=1 Tax=Ignisphaera aggregans (strain DSM 17230 / JCM 13409 / AQ1.S1) TaxID=583356 RepID=E0SQ96_IGNAA|nr:DNA-directed RNA polymerase, subunit N [Ignisphaera aggregans DSM 17230]
MIIPVRCFTCGYPIGAKWEEFYRRVKSGEDPGRVLDELGIRRYCCRRMMLSHIELLREVIRYGSIK